MMHTREGLDAYAAEVAAAIARAGRVPPEQFEYGIEPHEEKGLFRTKRSLVPYRRSLGTAWEVYRARKMYLLNSVDMRSNPHRQANESVGMMHEAYSLVIWLRPDGRLEAHEEADIERQYVTPTRRDVTYATFDGGDAFAYPGSDIRYREDEAQAKRAGYLVWGEWWCRDTPRPEDRYTGAAMALHRLATSLGVKVPAPI